MLYQLLTFFITIHHPKCVGLSHKVSYVYNEETWVVQLHHIYEFVLSEIQLIEYNSNTNFSNYISELAVTIFNIVSIIIILLIILLLLFIHSYQQFICYYIIIYLDILQQVRYFKHKF